MSFFTALTSYLSPPTTTSGPTAEPSAHPNTVRLLSDRTKEELKKGVAYNMKVVLRGMRGVGKTTLLAQICGFPIPYTYKPSQAISAGTIRIRGSDCAPHEGTKVDVWDVVDSSDMDMTYTLPPSLRKKIVDTLFRQNVMNVLSSYTSDAQSIDVYRNCNLVMLVVDCARPESLQYAVDECKRIPSDACILFVLNCMDRPKEEHKVTAAQVTRECAKLARTRTTFMQGLMRGNTVPHEYSLGPSMIEVSGQTGENIKELLRCLDTPNVLLRIALLEDKVDTLYRRLNWRQASQPPRPPVATKSEPMAPYVVQTTEPEGLCAAPPTQELKLFHRHVKPRALSVEMDRPNVIQEDFLRDIPSHSEEEEEEEEPAPTADQPVVRSPLISPSEVSEPSVSLGDVGDAAMTNFLEGVELDEGSVISAVSTAGSSVALHVDSALPQLTTRRGSHSLRKASVSSASKEDVNHKEQPHTRL
ncbi:hypothetical protein AGDE_13687 [Angomonas deanei]|uniref:Uncharacterized protein n=1 Tax=Angomonas deanei TaxID=59799 RepID=A0A7G2C0S2_9TRYP|nr:hypothetical protein AGDE_13687 [Angomonas deanei]CAD2213246.1 hypothetical protein, conserved [Angomonas deanei]|eukprot:EPY21875.1 hypothetical protein AGDE_13687 [Angomonas deanei]